MTEPAAHAPVRLWYMRDNHTFAELPLNIDAAMAKLREVFDGKCGHYGMLCSHQRDGVLHSKANWNDFRVEARQWLAKALQKSAAAPEVCHWTYSGDDWGSWETDCDNAFIIEDSKPSENYMRFCAYCGKTLVEVMPEPEAEDDDE